MEAYMKEHMTEDILNKTVELYQVQRENITFLGGFENFVYQVEGSNQSLIIRFVHSNHRTLLEVVAEIEFIDYLSRHGASVSTVIHSKNDNIVEQIPIDHNQYFSVSVFEKAPGTYVQDADKTTEFWEMFGSEVGRLHRLTKNFTPKNKRNHWFEERIEEMAERSLEEDDKEVLDLYITLKNRMMSLPRHKDNYGLIHTDLHFHNMYYHDHQLTFFDFDDSSYMYFISDIAIVIYYSFQHLVVGEHKVTKEEYNKRVQTVFSPFMKGYNKENHLAKEDFLALNDFIRFRAALLYIVLVASGFKHHEDERYRRFCIRQKERAIGDLMALDLEQLFQVIN